MKKLKAGFFSLYETEVKDSFVGTLLITDNHGIPLEFKCTHSVKASAIQKALYGDRLEPYIGIELCGVPLIKSISNVPDLLFVNLPYLMAIRSRIEIPLILIGIANSIEITDKESLEEVVAIESELIIKHEYETFGPLSIQSHPDYKKDTKNFPEEIKALFNNFDLSEPFERMKKSVEILGRSDSKFK